MQRADTLSQADHLLLEMYRADIRKVGTLAHRLSDLAQSEGIPELAKAANEIEGEVGQDQHPISLVRPLNRLSQLLQTLS